MRSTVGLDDQRLTEACPYCDGTGDGDVVPGAHACMPCQTCGGTGRLDVEDARRLRENSARASRDSDQPKET